jgi:hypothetical protein
MIYIVINRQLFLGTVLKSLLKSVINYFIKTLNDLIFVSLFKRGYY